ncbi:MAG: glycosyltransferase [Patescibacteria group bacterium]
MSVYNGEKYLREAIESILNQIFRDFEFLIIDDASTDASREIIKSYADPRIRLLENQTNLGLTKSLNLGMRAATGEYIARMDADDVSLPERLEVQVKYLDANSKDALIGSLVEFIDEDGQRIGEQSSPAPSREMIYFGLAFNNMLAHSSAMFRLASVLDLGGYDEAFNYAQDYDLWSRLSGHCGLAVLDERLVRWRTTSSGISSNRGEAQKNCAKRIFVKRVRELIPGIDDAELRRLVRYHEGNPSLGDLVTFYRYHRAIVKAYSMALSSGRVANSDARSAPKRRYKDFKLWLTIAFPNLMRYCRLIKRKSSGR